jgi:FkbM family methyltransferase
MVRTCVKTLIKQSLAVAGFEIQRKKSAFDVQRALCQRPRPVILDVGANVGQTVTEYRRLFPDGKIYAFEPFPESFLTLKRSFSEDNNITPLELALSDHSGETILFSNNVAGTNSLLKTDERAERYWSDIVRTKDSVPVKIETLTNFCSSYSIEKIDILKIDVQGNELNVLRGALDLLERKTIDLLYFELIIAPTYENQPRMDEYFSFLYGLRYRVVDLYNPVKHGYELLQMDVLFAAR